MTYEQFHELCKIAEGYGRGVSKRYLNVDQYISYINSISWAQGLYKANKARFIAQLREIYRISKIKLSDAREMSGLSRTELSKRLNIPRRTIEDWEAGRSELKYYIKMMIFECLGILNFDRLNNL